jgi:hypothetical protein
MLQFHWARTSLNCLARLLWTLPPARKFPRLLQRALVPNDAHAGKLHFSVAAVCQAAVHMRHVLQAFAHTMLDTALNTAWTALCDQLDRASRHVHSVGVDLDGVREAHSVYLAAVQRACWLASDNTSQVRFISLSRRQCWWSRDDVAEASD